MPIRYYKLFDLLNRRGMKKSDLRSIISSATVAKLSKGEYISSEVIEKICLFLHCQPSDIMEVVEIEELEEPLENTRFVYKNELIDEMSGLVKETMIAEKTVTGLPFDEDEELEEQIVNITIKEIDK